MSLACCLKTFLDLHNKNNELNRNCWEGFMTSMPRKVSSFVLKQKKTNYKAHKCALSWIEWKQTTAMMSWIKCETKKPEQVSSFKALTRDKKFEWLKFFGNRKLTSTCSLLTLLSNETMEFLSSSNQRPSPSTSDPRICGNKKKIKCLFESVPINWRWCLRRKRNWRGKECTLRNMIPHPDSFWSRLNRQYDGLGNLYSDWQ